MPATPAKAISFSHVIRPHISVSPITISGMNINIPTLKHPNQSRDKPYVTNKGRDPPRREAEWMQECNELWLYRSAMEIHHRVPSLLGLLDGKTENSYSGKPTQVQSPARELEAL